MNNSYSYGITINCNKNITKQSNSYDIGIFITLQCLLQSTKCGPKGENLGTCSLEGIKGSPAEPSKVGTKFNTWLGVLISTP